MSETISKQSPESQGCLFEDSGDEFGHFLNPGAGRLRETPCRSVTTIRVIGVNL